MPSIYVEGHEVFANYGTQYGLQVRLSTDTSYTFDCNHSTGDLMSSECTANGYDAIQAGVSLSICGCSIGITIVGDSTDLVWTLLGEGDDPQETISFAWVEISDNFGSWFAWIYIDLPDTQLDGCDFVISIPNRLICIETGTPSSGCC